ncbi:MAG: ferritin-like domain-containing protein [Gaiellaceae bacterium MAG52_C11]|nr:ferritin-like domain-containing protein [Candidatus Gaiellasilicea maunaloa]
MIPQLPAGVDVTLDQLDRDGALREAGSRLPRGRFLGLAAGAAVAFGGLASPARGVTKGDVAILNYALSLEYLQSAFYTETERVAAVKGQAARAARVVGAVERAHVIAFRNLLGRKAIKRPLFDFRGTTEDQQAFLKTAVAFEDLAVAAYKGQAHLIESDAVLAAAVSIHSVEARHAAWVRHLFGIRPAANAFDEGKPRAEIERIVQSTSFVVARSRTRGRGGPRFTG